MFLNDDGVYEEYVAFDESDSNTEANTSDESEDVTETETTEESE